MRVDERGSENEARALDDAMAVGREPLPDLRHQSAVDAYVDDCVEPPRRIDHAGTSDHQVLRPARPDEDHATSIAVSTRTGPVVSRS